MVQFTYDSLPEDLRKAIIDSIFSMRLPFVITKGDEIVYANKVWQKHGGQILQDNQAEQSIEQNLFNEVRRITGSAASEEMCRHISQQFSAAIKSGSDYEFQVRDGRLLKGQYTCHDNGYVSGVEFDFTELKHRRAEAKKIRQMLQATLNGLSHGVLLYDLDGNVAYLNEALKGLISSMGIQVHEGMNHLDVRQQLPAGVKALFGEREDLADFEFIQKSADGRSFLMENRHLPEIGFLVTIVDVTELHSALEAAKEADSAKSRFLANMSHEIRTPMNGVLGIAQILGATNIDAKQKRCIEIIQSSSEALLTIINDILDFSKIEADKIEIYEEVFDVSETVRDAVNILRPQAKSKNLEIIVDDRCGGHLRGVGDVGRIRQVLLNLLSNAVKFTQEGFVKIQLSCQIIAPNVQRTIFQIKDTGIGIAPENLERIFETFEQSDNSTTRQFGGTGLGLAISQKLAGLMGGHIEVSSEIGCGSTFTFITDLAVDDRQSPPLSVRSAGLAS